MTGYAKYPGIVTSTVDDLRQYSKGIHQDHQIFAGSLSCLIREKMWETGWQDELHGKMTAPSFMEFLTRPVPDGIETTVPWVYARLKLAARIDDTHARFFIDALADFTRQVYLECGEFPGAIYEREAARHEGEKAKDQTDPESPEFVRQGTRTDMKHSGNATKSLSDVRNSKPHILRRLARHRPDLLEQYERGEITANAAAIQAGFRKRKTPYEQVMALWPRLTAAERAQLREAV